MSQRSVLFTITLCLVVANALAWFFVLYTPTPHLTVSFLNVGQGDAIFIESPTGRQLLIDGGRNRSVLRELSKRMSPLDRSIDMVIATHPDADHIGGLAEVIHRYRVAGFMTTDVVGTTNTAQALHAAVEEEEGVQEVTARRGMRLLLGGGAYADVLFPDRDVSGVETNTASVVMRVVYGDTSFMLTGDSPQAIEDWLVYLDGEGLGSSVLKAGHHGSRTSTSDTWLAAVHPETVVISAGKSNSYGHPHEETLAKVAASGAEIVSTVTGGVTFRSDGQMIQMR